MNVLYQTLNNIQSSPLTMRSKSLPYSSDYKIILLSPAYDLMDLEFFSALCHTFLLWFLRTFPYEAKGVYLNLVRKILWCSTSWVNSLITHSQNVQQLTMSSDVLNPNSPALLLKRQRWWHTFSSGSPADGNSCWLLSWDTALSLVFHFGYP